MYLGQSAEDIVSFEGQSYSEAPMHREDTEGSTKYRRGIQLVGEAESEENGAAESLMDSPVASEEPHRMPAT